MKAQRRTARTTKPAVHAQDVQAQQPKRVHVTPPWARKGYRSSMQHVGNSVSTWIEFVSVGRLRLPSFQRPWVWTDEQVRRLLQSVVEGCHVGSLLLWRRYKLPAWQGRFGELEVNAPAHDSAHCAWIVVDGQQRLGALATASCAERFRFDLRDASVVVSADEAPWLVPFSLLTTEKGMWRILDGWCREHAVRHGLSADEVEDGVIHAAALVAQSWALGAVEIPADWPLTSVVESFKRINAEGTPMDPEDLRRGLERAFDGSAQ